LHLQIHYNTIPQPRITFIIRFNIFLKVLTAVVSYWAISLQNNWQTAPVEREKNIDVTIDSKAVETWLTLFYLSFLAPPLRKALSRMRDQSAVRPK
jgi:hypothetical protein